MIIVVTGLGRCGTSMVMKMLTSAGLPGFYKEEHSFETECQFYLPQETVWLNECEGKCVKILDPHKWQLPKNRKYKFIFLTRDAKEQAKSHIKFLKAVAPQLNVGKRQIPMYMKSMIQDTAKVKTLLKSYPGSEVLNLSFEGILKQRNLAASQISMFLCEYELDHAVMAAQVMERTHKCHPELLELRHLV